MSESSWICMGSSLISMEKSTFGELDFSSSNSKPNIAHCPLLNSSFPSPSPPLLSVRYSGRLYLPTLTPTPPCCTSPIRPPSGEIRQSGKTGVNEGAIKFRPSKVACLGRVPSPKCEVGELELNFKLELELEKLPAVGRGEEEGEEDTETAP